MGAVAEVYHGQADAIVRDALVYLQSPGKGGGYGKMGVGAFPADAPYFAQCFDDSRKHAVDFYRTN
jgi:hypothetical protein